MQKFEPDQLVLVRYIGNKVWRLKRYSFFDGQEHETQDGATFRDKDILPYSGNEHLLGTTNSPEPKWEPKPGELVTKMKDVSDNTMEEKFKIFNSSMIWGGLGIAVHNGKSLADWIYSVVPILKKIDCGMATMEDLEAFCREWNLRVNAIFILFDQYVEADAPGTIWGTSQNSEN